MQIINTVFHTLWKTHVDKPSFPHPVDFAVDKSEFSTGLHVDFSPLLFLPRLFCVLFTPILPHARVFNRFRTIFPHSFAGFGKLGTKPNLHFCQNQYFPFPRDIFHKRLKSDFVDKSRKNSAFLQGFKGIYSHSGLLNSFPRAKIPLLWRFSEGERKFPRDFQRITKRFSRENWRCFQFSEYSYGCGQYTYI